MSPPAFAQRMSHLVGGRCIRAGKNSILQAPTLPTRSPRYLEGARARKCEREDAHEQRASTDSSTLVARSIATRFVISPGRSRARQRARDDERRRAALGACEHRTRLRGIKARDHRNI